MKGVYREEVNLMLEGTFLLLRLLHCGQSLLLDRMCAPIAEGTVTEKSALSSKNSLLLIFIALHCSTYESETICTVLIPATHSNSDCPQRLPCLAGAAHDRKRTPTSTELTLQNVQETGLSPQSGLKLPFLTALKIKYQEHSFTTSWPFSRNSKVRG